MLGALILFPFVSTGHLQAQESKPGSPNNNPSVRIMRNEDGSYTEFRRSSDERVIERRTYGDRPGGSGDRVLRMSIIYRKDVHGKLRSGIIYDGSGKKLFRVVYGYHKHTGALVAEDMFRTGVKFTKTFTDKVTGKPYEKEIPVRYLRHRYDAQGRQLKPLVYCLPQGKKAEDLFGKDGSTHADPWSEQGGRTINPSARPTR